MNLILRDIYWNCICSSLIIPSRFRRFLYKMGGAKIGKGTFICPNCFVGNNNLTIGNNVFINYNVWFNTAGGINIGNNCNIAYDVKFVTSSHNIGSCERRASGSNDKSIVVGDGTWIGASTVILPGVIIGKGCVIGAGSVVTKSCDDNCLYVGNPAKLVRKLL